ETHLASFDEEVNRAYAEYQVYDEYANSYYAIKLVYGIVNDKMSYGVSFFSEQAQAFTLKIAYQNQVYLLPTDNRGDIKLIALNLKEASTFSLLVYDKDNHLQALNRFQNIEVVPKNDFLNLPNHNVGLNEGVKFVSLNSINWSPLTIFYLGLLVVFMICAVVIIIFYWRKKGFFEKENRESFFEVEVIPSAEAVNGEEETFVQTPLIEPIKEEQFIWEDDDEQSKIDIPSHLQSLGLSTQYQDLSEMERFKIMEVLIKLRDEKLITNDDYLKEVAKLWRK
ncbi:MAG TPA: hypothetical protein PK087_02975, partial [Bacilli bacterium]|nr:hypothetical protein [Bacilli bacterium]